MLLCALTEELHAKEVSDKTGCSLNFEHQSRKYHASFGKEGEENDYNTYWGRISCLFLYLQFLYL